MIAVLGAVYVHGVPGPPSGEPSSEPTALPSGVPTSPSCDPSTQPSGLPSVKPTCQPSATNIEVMKLLASDGAGGDYLGAAVALYENILVIGAYGAESVKGHHTY